MSFILNNIANEKNLMNSVLTRPKRGANRLYCWLLLFILLLIALPLLPKSVQAQQGEAELVLSLRNERYNYNIEAMAGQDNRFFLEVRNTGVKPITNLRLSSRPPESWTVEVKPAEISDLSPGSLVTIDVNIKPAGKTFGGGYPVVFVAQSSEIQKEQPFWVRVKGELELNLSLHRDQFNFNLEAKAGQDNKFFLEVRNTGAKPITNIKLTAEEPEGWIIEFKPAEITYLGAGNPETIEVNIKPVGKAIKESFSVTFVAQANELVRRQPFSVSVNPAQFWLWVWILAGVVVVAGFVLIYWRFGRQKSGT